jgi:hypothetical protein
MSVRSVLVGALLVLPAASLVVAQAPTPPKPAPEVQKLAFFAGRWNETVNVNASPMGPGGKVTMTSTCEWFAGGFNLVCKEDGTGPTGPAHSMAIFGYSTERKHYTHYGYGNDGGGDQVLFGDVAGDTWNWEWDASQGGQQMKFRVTVKQTSPDAYTFKLEASAAGDTWNTISEGTDTRIK